MINAKNKANGIWILAPAMKPAVRASEVCLPLTPKWKLLWNTQGWWSMEASPAHSETHTGPSLEGQSSMCYMLIFSCVAYPAWRARTWHWVVVLFGFPQKYMEISHHLKTIYFEDNGVWSPKFCAFALFLNFFLLSHFIFSLPSTSFWPGCCLKY